MNTNHQETTINHQQTTTNDQTDFFQIAVIYFFKIGNEAEVERYK